MKGQVYMVIVNQRSIVNPVAALRVQSCRITLCCVLGRSMVVRERAVYFTPHDPVASGTYLVIKA